MLAISNRCCSFFRSKVRVIENTLRYFKIYVKFRESKEILIRKRNVLKLTLEINKKWKTKYIIETMAATSLTEYNKKIKEI